MKTILLIGMMMMGVVVMGQNNVVNHSYYNVTEFTELCLTDLKVSGVTVMIGNVQNKIGGQYEGITVKTGEHIYMIWTTRSLNRDDFQSILCHELVHVMQYENGLTINGHVATYQNLNYEASDSQHYYRPYEVEARDLGKKLFNKFKDIY